MNARIILMFFYVDLLDVIAALANPISYVNQIKQRASQLAALTEEEGEQDVANKVGMNNGILHERIENSKMG